MSITDISSVVGAYCHQLSPQQERRLFAAMAMQGWLANKDRPQHFHPKDDMAYCVAIADALLAELSKEPSV